MAISVKNFTPSLSLINIVMNKGVTPEESDALMLMFQSREDFAIDLNEKLQDLEHFYILRAMAENNNNQTKAAQALGIKRETLIHKLKKYSIL